MLFTGSGGHRAAALVDACPSLKNDEQRTQRNLDIYIAFMSSVYVCTRFFGERPDFYPSSLPPGSKFS